MDDERIESRMAHLRKAIDALSLALRQPEDEFVRDSIIKRFELAFETARKAAREWLMREQEVDEHSTKKGVMESAFRTGLLSDSDLWSELSRLRNDSSHEYDAGKAIEAAAFIRARAVDAFEQLYATLGRRA